MDKHNSIQFKKQFSFNQHQQKKMESDPFPCTVYCKKCSGKGLWQECEITNRLLHRLEKMIRYNAAFSDCDYPELMISKIIVRHLKCHVGKGQTPDCVKEFLSDCVSDDSAIESKTPYCDCCYDVFTLYTHREQKRTVYTPAAGPMNVCIVHWIKYFVKMMYENGMRTCDMNYSYLCSHEMTSLVDASRKGNIEKVKSLMELRDECGQLICIPSVCYFQALYNAIYYGRIEIV